MLKNIIVYYDSSKWAAVPANNGGNGPIWQWGDELLVGFNRGTFLKTDWGHQCDNDHPFESWLAGSVDGGESWTTWMPDGYAGMLNETESQPVPGGVDFSRDGFLLRAEGAGYHGNRIMRWFHSDDKGDSWKGPYEFSGLMSHPELEGKQFTSRTGYIINGPRELMLFLSVRDKRPRNELDVKIREKTFVAATHDGGESFSFISWVVPWEDPFRAVMPAPVRVSDTKLITGIRRKSPDHNWIDCFVSENNGVSWSFLSKVGETETGNKYNGNPPSLIKMADGRLCAAYGNRTDRQIVARCSGDEGRTWTDPLVLRNDFESANGHPDLGYARLFQRKDGKLVTAYFWCTADRPETHIEATIFDAP